MNLPNRSPLLFVAIAFLSCTGKRGMEHDGHSGPQTATTTAQTPVASSSSVAEQLQPLTGHPWYLQFEVGQGRRDIITLPLGAGEPRPIVVAVHGGGDRPEWACGIWRIAVESYAFVVCPVGLSTGAGRFAWGTDKDITAAVERALSQARNQFTAYLRPAPMIYAGFSQGATLAGDYLIAHAAQFPIAALAEGGYDYLSSGSFGTRYFSAGGRRLLLVCGTPGCLVTANRAAINLKRAGLEVTVLSDMGSGHGIGTALQKDIRRHWAQLVEGVDAWESFPRHRWPEEW